MEKGKKLIVEDLTISFRQTQGLVRAVRGVSFELNEGETLAIVGESGSGKSVTSRAIMGILAGNGVIDKGRIIYEDQDLTKISEENFHKIRGNQIGMIFQDPLSSLNPIMRIGKQVTEGMIVNGKRLKNRYKSLIHRSLMEIYNAKYERRDLKETYRREKKDLKQALKAQLQGEKVPEQQQESRLKQGADAQALKKEAAQRLQALSEQFKKDMERNKKRIKDANVAIGPKKVEARKTVKQEWHAKKQETKKELAELRKKLSGADNETKKAVRKEISDTKEQLRRFKKVTKKEAVERALKVMDEVGIPEPRRRLRQYPFQFSGGMRQRIVIAIALTADPDILICDEPTTALDVTIQAQILELINNLKEERNLTVIFITHDLGVVANMADRIAVMYAGKIVEIGTADEVFYDARHPYTWALMSSVPDLTTHERLLSIPGTPPNMLFPPQGDAFADRSQYAMKIDYELEPPMFKISNTHYAATWLLHPKAPKVEMPEILKKRIKTMTEGTGEVTSG